MDCIDMLVEDIVEVAEDRFPPSWPTRDEDIATLLRVAAIRLDRAANARVPRDRTVVGVGVMGEAATRRWIRAIFRHALRPPTDDEWRSPPKSPDPTPTRRERVLEDA
jgi:hypothetical protein